MSAWPRFVWFTDLSCDRIIALRSILCVGLDPQFEQMPPHLLKRFAYRYGRTVEAIGRMFLEFNRRIIDQIADIAVWVKPQMAFYECYGHWGVWAYEETVKYARKKGLLVITDGKRGDGGDTARAYAETYLGLVPYWPAVGTDKSMRVRSPMRSDALTIHGWIAEDCIGRFVSQMKENGTCCFVVDKTSFKPNSAVEQLETVNGLKVWEELAQLVGKWGDGTEGTRGWRNLGVVMGGTYPEETVRMRAILPKTWFLVPGYGAQGGGSDEAVLGADEDGFGVTVNSSRGIIFAWKKAADSKHFALAARAAAIQARDDLNAALLRANKGRAFLVAA